MDTQPVEPTVDLAQTAAAAFDAAVTSETTAPEPEPAEGETTDAARDAKGQYQKAPDVETTPARKPRQDTPARIAQVLAQKREAEQRAEAAEQRAQAHEQELARLRQPPPAPRVDAAPAKPAENAEKFPRFDQWSATHPEATHDDYLDARDDWRDARRDVVQRERAETQHQTQAFETRASTFGQRYAEAAQADPTLPTRINPQLLSAKPLSTLTAQDKAIIAALPDKTQRDQFAFLCFLADRWIDSEHAVPLLEHLSDPRTFQRLATLPPDQVIEELAMLKAGFAAAPSSRGPAAKPHASQAHPPITPLGSAPRTPDADDGSDDEPIEKFFSRENAKDRKAGRLG